jgi:hypothetical protein
MFSFRDNGRQDFLAPLRRAGALLLGLAFPILLVACDSRHVNPNAPSTPDFPTNPSTNYTIAGRVTETAPTETTPVAHASISVVNADGSQLPGAVTTTNEPGSFTLVNIPAGTRTLVANADGYTSARLNLSIARSIEAVQLHLDPQGDQVRQLTADCGKPPQVLTFPVHHAGTVLVEGTARGVDRWTDYIMVRLSLDGQSHIADFATALFFAGSYIPLSANVPGAGVYQASISLDTCFPVELRVTAPK